MADGRPRSLGYFIGVGALVFGVLGGLVGLVVGLRTYPRTAPFAVVELGVPCAALGVLFGLLVGLVSRIGRAGRSR